jgi:hypothetical protein
MTHTLNTCVKRGKEIGVTLTPHRYEDGNYVASHERFKTDYVRVPSLAELITLWERGYKIRMSAKDSNYHRSPSLITTGAIFLVKAEGYVL